MTDLPAPVRSARARVVGVDVLRGLAIFGMVAVHVFDGFGTDYGPNAAAYLAQGRSATAFAFVAGISIAFLSGGATPVTGRRRTAAAAGIAARGVLIGLLGLLLAYLQVVGVILSSYGLMFLLVIPLLGLRARTLAVLATVIAVAGPVLLVATADLGLPYAGEEFDPTLTTLLTEPGALLVLLLLTGLYPVVVYFGYLCAGLAVGRLDLSSRRLAWWLLGGGLALVALAQAVSVFLLHLLGSVTESLAASGYAGATPAERAGLIWDASYPAAGSWWYLAIASPHSHTNLDVANTLGSALALLGLALLLTRIPAVRRALGPLADVGAMPLTVYTAQVLILWTEVLDDEPAVFFVLLVAAFVGFAVWWRRRFGQGPLERLLAAASGRARTAVVRRAPPCQPALTPTAPSSEGP